MPTLTDARFDALRVLVPAAPPTTNDMLRQWLIDNGGTGVTIGDLWYSFFIAQGGTPGLHRNDLIREFLTNEGFVEPHINDAWLAFWLAGGVPGGGPGAGFVTLRSIGAVYESVTGVGPTLLSFPAGRQVGDLLVVNAIGTFFTAAAHPTENPGPWTTSIADANHVIAWRIATGDANDNFTMAALSPTGAHVAVMHAYDLSAGPYTSVALAAGGFLANNDSGGGTAWPTSGFSQYNNDQSISFIHSLKSTNVVMPVSGTTDNLDAVVAALPNTTESGVIAQGEFDGLAGNPGGTRSSWYIINYHVTDANPAEAVPFGTDQTEAPESSGFEVVSYYGTRLRITL